MKAALATAAIVLAGALAAGTAVPTAWSDETPAAPTTNPDDWLMNAPDADARFKLLQDQLRGFSSSMIEVGQRFNSLYDAVNDGNGEYAVYQWKKIKEVIVDGYARRPKRQPNADEILVKSVFEPILADLASGDKDKAWAAFTLARAACLKCHEAEKVSYINDQPLFRNTENPRD